MQPTHAVLFAIVNVRMYVRTYVCMHIRTYAWSAQGVCLKDRLIHACKCRYVGGTTCRYCTFVHIQHHYVRTYVHALAVV